MNTAIPWAGSVFNWMAIAARTGLIVMTVVICADAIGRSFFTHPVKWALELSSYMLTVVAFLPAAYALHHDRHIRVDLITQFFPPAGKRVSNLAGSLLGIIYASVLTWQGWTLALRSFESGEMAIGGLGMQLWIPEMLIPIGGGLFALAFIFTVIQGLQRPAAVETTTELTDGS